MNKSMLLLCFAYFVTPNYTLIVVFLPIFLSSYHFVFQKKEDLFQHYSNNQTKIIKNIFTLYRQIVSYRQTQSSFQKLAKSITSNHYIQLEKQTNNDLFQILKQMKDMMQSFHKQLKFRTFEFPILQKESKNFQLQTLFNLSTKYRIETVFNWQSVGNDIFWKYNLLKSMSKNTKLLLKLQQQLKTKHHQYKKQHQYSNPKTLQLINIMEVLENSRILNQEELLQLRRKIKAILETVNEGEEKQKWEKGQLIVYQVEKQGVKNINQIEGYDQQVNKGRQCLQDRSEFMKKLDQLLLKGWKQRMIEFEGQQTFSQKDIYEIEQKVDQCQQC